MSRSRDSTHYENIFENNVNFRERVIYLNSDIEESSLELFQKAMDELEKNSDIPIRIEISSYGGNVYDMLGMVDRIQSSRVVSVKSCLQLLSY
jgi:membrane-bound ClpP family serine protease